MYNNYLTAKRSLTSFLSFLKTPHKIITAKLSICNLASSSVLIMIIQQDYIKIKPFATINLCNFSTKLNFKYIHHANVTTTNFIYYFAFTFKLKPRQTIQSVAFPPSMAPYVPTPDIPFKRQNPNSPPQTSFPNFQLHTSKPKVPS